MKDHSDLTGKLDTEFSEFEVLMAKYKTNDQSYTSYDKLSEKPRQSVHPPMLKILSAKDALNEYTQQSVLLYMHAQSAAK